MKPLKSWSWFLTVRYSVGRLLGLAGATGAMLFVCATLLIFSVAPHWRKDAAEMKDKTVQLARDENRLNTSLMAEPDIGEQVRAFAGRFPRFGQNVSDLQQVFDLAQKANVQLDKGEYQILATTGNTLVNYEVVLPVKANYAAIRGLVAGVLNALPHASLSELRMARGGVDSDVLDVRIRFTFIYRGA